MYLQLLATHLVPHSFVWLQPRSCLPHLSLEQRRVPRIGTLVPVLALQAGLQRFAHHRTSAVPFMQLYPEASQQQVMHNSYPGCTHSATACHQLQASFCGIMQKMPTCSGAMACSPNLGLLRSASRRRSRASSSSSASGFPPFLRAFCFCCLALSRSRRARCRSLRWS